MARLKIQIIVLFQNLTREVPYYAKSPAPPLPGILLAGMTPPIVDVEVLHEMARPIRYDINADVIALSFMDYLSPHAFEVAARFRARGKTVIGGGKYISTFPEEAQGHFDSILVGEAQGVWPVMVHDLVAGRLKPRYDAPATPSLADIPPPRYDLVERSYTVPIVTETSRGCPHPCTYCQLNINRQPFRARPVEDVVRDLTATKGLPWWRRKVAMILDNNLGGDLKHAKNVLREVARLKFWGVGVQFSVECLRDPEFVDLLDAANCRMAFIGMESLNEASLRGVQKRQNKVDEYREAFRSLHERGILTFTGLMFALEEDTVDYYRTLPRKLREVGTMVILPSISIPIYGTPWYRQVVAEGRLTDTDLSHYEGDHLVFRHPRLSEDEIGQAYEGVTREFYRPAQVLRRWVKFVAAQRHWTSAGSLVFRLALSFGIYAQLSFFQWHHARERVFGRSRGAVARRVDRSVDRPGEAGLATSRTYSLRCTP
jgi:radical SAM superfamily enzyme YgiQ (UPF0313 family)